MAGACYRHRAQPGDFERAPIPVKEMTLRTRRYLIALLALAVGLIGLLLAASGTAGSVPKENTTVITPTTEANTTQQPDLLFYNRVHPADGD
jgi:hypothetical protein